MRPLGQFENESLAGHLAQALEASGIASEVRANLDGNFVLWIVHEEQMEQARSMFHQFEKNPRSVSLAPRRSVKPEASQPKDRYRKVELGDTWRSRLTPWGTYGLMAVCIAVYLAVYGVHQQWLYEALIYARDPGAADFLEQGFWEALGGQPWRIITPMFLHASPSDNLIHIVFNLWALKQLGELLERSHGIATLLLVTFCSAAISNAWQYSMDGPYFVGISGVVYGVFAFLWLRSRTDPSVGYKIPPSLVIMLLAWLAMGFVLPSFRFANYAHLGGLLVGAAMGAFSGILRRS